MIAAVGIGAGLVVAVILIRVLENRFIYFPPRYPQGFVPPAHYGVPVEESWITTEDGVRLNAWFLPASSPNVLLWFHGNAENVGSGLAHLKVLGRLGVNVMALDYRGYGKSEGSPNEAGIYRDAEAAYRYLTEAKHFEAGQIVIYGHSLGGAVAIDLASRHDCGGAIVESTFTRARDMARRMLLIPLLEYIPQSRFDSLNKIARIKAPILVVHGTDDEVIPFAMGQKLYDAAWEPKEFFAVEGAGHNDVSEVGGEKYLHRLRSFIRRSVREQ